MNNVLNAIFRVLNEAKKPLHYEEITNIALNKGYWKTDAKSPKSTVNAQLAIYLRDRGEKAQIQKVCAGVFKAVLRPKSPSPSPISKATSDKAAATLQPESVLSFTDAAEKVLQTSKNRTPMHYRDILAQAMQLHLVATTGNTPEASLYASILKEVKRDQRRGEEPRFFIHGKGLISLTKWLPTGIPSQIEKHNREVREKLHDQLRSIPPSDFEGLIGQLLVELGFQDVSVTQLSGDGGIDVRGTLVVGDVIRTRMAVQVKRWRHNVQAPIVQQVRGSLGTHEHGLIITTSDFSSGARQESLRPDAVPVGLMNGEQLVSLLIENDIGVRKTTYDLLEIGSVSPLSES